MQNEWPENILNALKPLGFSVVKVPLVSERNHALIPRTADDLFGWLTVDDGLALCQQVSLVLLLAVADLHLGRGCGGRWNCAHELTRGHSIDMEDTCSGCFVLHIVPYLTADTVHEMSSTDVIC